MDRAELIGDRAAEGGASAGVVPTGRARTALALAVSAPLAFGVAFAISPRLGVLISPLPLIGSLTAVILAISARLEIGRTYRCGPHVFQPVEPELLKDRAATTWALCLALPVLPFEVIVTLVLFFF